MSDRSEQMNGEPLKGRRDGLSIGKTAEEIHADLIGEGQSVTLAEVEARLEEWAAIGFIEKADLSVGEAVELAQQEDDPPST
jgi:Fe2+ or Zn2+ uptake regulation protein